MIPAISLTEPEVTRNCIRCLTALGEDGAYCRRCRGRSAMKLCRHLATDLAWRVLSFDHVTGLRRPLSLTIGEVTVQEETLPYPLLYENTRRTIPVMLATEVLPGSDILARLILLNHCHVCAVAFLLPETEVFVLKGEPRIVRSPRPSSLHVFANVER